MYDIIPLAYTRVDWKVLIDTCKEALNMSPTRGLDNAGIKLDDHQAYLACLGLDNNPIGHLRSGGWDGSFKHVHYSFITITRLDVVATFCGDIDCMYRIINIKTDECLAIFTGSMEQWQRFVVKYAVEDVEIEFRIIACRIMNHFENLGFRDLWSGYTKQTLTDKSFKLKRR